MPRRPTALLGTALLAAAALADARAAERADPGWALQLVGAPRDVPRETFERAVLAAVPDDLKGRGTNFTQDETFRPEASYRIVLVFHAEEEIAAEALCPAPDAVDPGRPELDDLMSTVHVTAALCEDRSLLRTATDRMTGQILPEQASFRFLVEDVVRQLFPDGFTRLPRTAS